MKKLLTFLTATCLACNIFAQTWQGTGGIIPDDGTPAIYPITVSDLNPASIDSIHGLSSIRINLTHTYDADLLIALIAPDGTSIVLSDGNGGDGDNYTNTIFTDTAFRVINQGSAPFTGYYKPQEQMGSLNNGREGNGIWYLYILDKFNSDQGNLLDWEITFSDHPTAPFAFTSSNLPIILIDTYGQEIPDDPKIQVGMKVIDNGQGQRNYVSDNPVYDAYAGIEIRGSSSQMFPKKSYGFETWDSQGEEVDISMLGMPEESDWILNANYTDKTLCRNALAYQVSRNLGHYATRYKYVEVVINGIYKGIYVFSEKIKRDANRVNIAKLKPDQNSGDQLTGGYIFKIDKTTGSGGDGWISNFPPENHNNGQTIFFQYEFPKAEDITDPQKAYISNYVNSFESTLAGPDFANPETGFRQFVDELSFIDYFLVNEISKNVDGYRLSTFLHKERESLGGKLRIGPVWDYDIAWHNADYCGGTEVEGWAYQFPCTDDYWQVPFWWERLLEDTAFANNLKCRWTMLRDNLLSDNWFDQYIDSVALLLNESQERNFTVWPILGVYVWPNPWPYPPTYAEEISSLKNWIHQRLAWIDQNLPGTCNSTATDFADNHQAAFSIFPNPASNILYVKTESNNMKEISFTISDPTGRIIISDIYQNPANGFIEWHADISKLSPGIWLITINNGLKVHSARFIKQ
ncbi:MAG: CotH kinase family protein [Lentimicrobiaceae bacterium]|nr:CotH kinase family protein [Lentimicrobiaceae bacterium]